MTFENQTEVIVAHDITGVTVAEGDVVSLDLSKVQLNLPMLDKAVGFQYRVLATLPTDLLSPRQVNVTSRRDMGEAAVKIAVIQNDPIPVSGVSAVPAPYRCWVPSDAIRCIQKGSATSLVPGRDYAATTQEANAMTVH